MANFSRRKILRSLAMAGASSVVRSVPAQQSLAPGKDSQHLLLDYFAKTGPLLLRDPEGALRHPSISPSPAGRAYSAQLWDWDTYWTSLGLFRLARLSGDESFRQKICQHTQGSLYSFLDYQAADGRIPIMVSATSQDPFGSADSNNLRTHNQAKPMMAQIALLVADELRDTQWLATRFDRILRFHDSWVKSNMSPLGLLVWGDDVAIGDDNDPTTFGRPGFSSANLLLNCLFYQDLKAAAELANRLNRPQDQQRLSLQARTLGANIQKYCWDPRDNFYYTVDVQCVDRRAELIPDVKRGMSMSWQCLPLRVQMFTGFLPLWCGLATPQQAQALVQANYLKDQRFRSDWGVRSLSKMETMYSLDFSSNPSNWLGPVWLIVNYLVWKGLKDYQFHQAATDLGNKTARLLSSDILTSGGLNEYYHPDTGAPLSHHGFIDWNMLVLEMI